jgi:hypothetical protein
MNIEISQPTSVYEAHISANEIITGTGVTLGGLVSNSSCKRIKEFNNEAKD